MNIFQKKLSIGFATATVASILLTSSAFASTEVSVTGNGWKSDNTVKVYNNCYAGVYQSNETNAVTSINSSADTGNVKANGNTGGTTDVLTGDAASIVKVNVWGGANSTEAPSCCECATGDTTVDVSENGSKSDTEVKVSNTNSTKTTQKSKTSALTGVDSNAKTGRVKANWNTGNGASVVTGSSLSKVKVNVGGGSNTVNP